MGLGFNTIKVVVGHHIILDNEENWLIKNRKIEVPLSNSIYQKPILYYQPMQELTDNLA